MKKILVATDGSPASAGAEAAAIDLCVEHGAELVVVHCWRAPGEWLGQPYYQHAVARELAAARAAVTGAVTLAELRDVPVEAEIVEGSPAEHILEVAATHGVDLVVVGARGTTPLERLFVGSVSTTVMRLATIPVLVVKEGWSASNRDGERPGMEAAPA
jgi:nucleotide-binding universal stress UspA family protein